MRVLKDCHWISAAADNIISHVRLLTNLEPVATVRNLLLLGQQAFKGFQAYYCIKSDIDKNIENEAGLKEYF